MLECYRGKSVFITGHTGFKGAWLCEILLAAGAKVHGYALPSPTQPSLFDQLDLTRRLASNTLGDVRDLSKLSAALRRARPDFIFHLAAQPLVRVGYREPDTTFATNVMGTVNLLEAVRRMMTESKKRTQPLAVVCITTDKVYENDNAGCAFVESNPLGGADPYSASKGACEIAIASYRRSFFADADCPVRIASARAGNVIGGGDWADDRIVPDAMRAFLRGKTLAIRNANSTRPWQHVLEPLAGYLRLGAWLNTPAAGLAAADLRPATQAFNFGPDTRTVRTVAQLVAELRKRFPEGKVRMTADPQAPAEAKLLRLNSSKAKRWLAWHPQWNFWQTVAMTADWYAAVADGADPGAVTRKQISQYFSER